MADCIAIFARRDLAVARAFSFGLSAYMDAPFAKHSFDDGEKVKIACIHPVLLATIAADLDGIRRPVPDQCFELQAPADSKV